MYYNVEGILAIIGVFFLPAIVVVSALWFQHKRLRVRADLYSKALEKGQTIPPDWFSEPLKQPKKKRNPLNTGIICMAVGVGVSLFFGIIHMDSPPVRSLDINSQLVSGGMAMGIIPFIIGVAYVIIYFIEKKKNTEEHA